MATTARNWLCGLLLLLGFLATHPSLLRAQESDAVRRIYGQIFDVMGKTNPGNARDNLAKCVAIGENLKNVQGIIGPLRLDLEALIQRCIFVAMNRGEFSDKTGDQCSHHYAFVKKLAAAVDGWIKEPNNGGQDLSSRARELETTIHNGGLIGCKNNDYKIFNETIAAAKSQKR